MVKLLLLKTTLFSALFISSITFGQKFGFDKVLRDQPNTMTAFSVPYSKSNQENLLEAGISIKYITKEWLFISATPSWMNESLKNGLISDFYFEHYTPTVLADTARIWHNVNPVHNGQSPLNTAYTGQNVIVGIVDQGLDWNHPDFIDANGDTRVLRYWDHSYDGPNPALPYNYGQLWDSTAINNGTCTSTEEATAHGTTVAGMAVGNARANGTQRGMAPDANIIIIETNFNRPNWSLTIADAVDYIFKVADSLNMPAVVNLSLGSYYGSHDNREPATQLIDALLDEKPGRIVVCAAGNSGDKGNYHQRNEVTSDTSFVWFLNNPSSQIAANTIYFDLWTDMTDATWRYSFAADTPGPSYNFRGRLSFRDATSNLGGIIYDTLWNNGNRLATFEIYPEQVGSNYHMEIVAAIDSTSYYYRFETTGSGNYDLWSGAWIGLNDMVTTLPTAAEMPDIVNYVMPDSLQTIVSLWNCSDKVVSVGVFRNKTGFWDNNGNLQSNTTLIPGQLNPGSSKGPTRLGLIKPDVAASGDMTLTAAPLWILTNPAYWNYIDSGGWHGINGGTSMASPIVAGIAALYLERCPYATYADFRDDLFATSYSDAFTGTLPNYSFGYGKPNAFALLNQQQLNTVTPTISVNGTQLESSPDYGYQWILDGELIDNETASTYSPQPPYGSYQVLTYNEDGCTALSSPLNVAAGIDESNLLLMTLYPNPTKDIFHLSNNDARVVKIIDEAGKEISFEHIGSGHYRIGATQSGLYLLIAELPSGDMTTLRLILK